MEERHIDARGLECPKPVVLTRSVIQEPGAERVRVVVDNEVSVENIRRMAKSQGWEVAVEKTEEGIHLILSRQEGAATAGEPAAEPRARPSKVVVLVTSDVLGTGEEELGRILMRAFIKTLKELDPQPSQLIFVNAGVRLTTKGSDLVDDLRELAGHGVEILSCGTCLDYYGLVDLLEVGAVTNMYEICSALVEADRVLQP